MSKFSQEVLDELDIIVKEEYGKLYSMKLFEADNDDDDVLSTPISRAASFPARALRFKKAKSVMKKYEKKILTKIDKVIARFEKELDKSIPQITTRGKDLQAALEAAKRSGDEVEAKAIVNQQKKFNEDVKKNQDERANNLNQTIDNLITTYTTAIHKRIDEPGYVLKVEISDKGKADLKFMWDEIVSTIKQKGYEKLVKVINNKNVKELESLVSRLEVEIEKAEDERRRWRSSSSRSSLSGAGSSSAGDGATGGDKGKPDPAKPAKDGADSSGSQDYKDLKKYLDEELPMGILEDNESYKYTTVGGKIFDVYFEIEDRDEKIVALFFEDGADTEDTDPVKEVEIKEKSEIDDIVDGINKGEESHDAAQTDAKYQKYAETLYNSLETMFQTRKKYITDVFNSTFYNEYSDKKQLKQFVKYVIGQIADHPDEYSKLEKVLKNQSISDRYLINLFLKKFYKDFKKAEGTTDESFVSLSNYKKLNS